MSILLNLRPEVEASALERAKANGLPLETYLQSVIEHEVLPHPRHTLTIEELDAALDELAQGSEHLPVLPDEALSRAAIYADHD